MATLRILSQVIDWENNLVIPPIPKISPEAVDLILKLCTDADRRLGKNANEVKAHPFLKPIDFKKGVRCTQPPYVPKIQNSMDTSHFDTIDSDNLRTSTTEDEFSDNQPLHAFFEFTFRRFFDDGGGGVPFPTRLNLDENDNQGAAVYV